MSRTRVVRIGIIGAGFARTTQIPGFKNCDDAQIVAIASAHREHAAEVAREFDIEQVEDDWKALVARPDLDLVSIVTPPFTHCEMALAALDNGKAVLCEKPMAMNAAETSRMVERARSKGCLALIDHELRFLPGRLQMRAAIRQGEIGKVKHVKLTFRSDSRADPDRAWNWWSDETKGGGVLGAIGSHVVDGFRWLLDAEVEQVSCQLATHIRRRQDRDGNDREVTSDDEANLLLRFADSEFTAGATGNVSMSMVEPGESKHRLEIFGANGALAVGDRGDLWRAALGEGKWVRVETDAGELSWGMSDSGWGRGFTAFSKAIVKAVRESQSSVEGAASFEDGHRTQIVLDAARRSDQSGCRENV